MVDRVDERQASEGARHKCTSRVATAIASYRSYSAARAPSSHLARMDLVEQDCDKTIRMRTGKTLSDAFDGPDRVQTPLEMSSLASNDKTNAPRHLPS
ncbi:hypothetical protein J1614_012283 [Plenodomus biglobosus]|nr:hypothetical protein J1614_012283 [Plenodomus biglobosus]